MSTPADDFAYYLAPEDDGSPGLAPLAALSLVANHAAEDWLLANQTGERVHPFGAYEAAARAVVLALADHVERVMVHFCGPELEWPWGDDRKSAAERASFDILLALFAEARATEPGP